jgi:hypothetical protein
MENEWYMMINTYKYTPGTSNGGIFNLLPSYEGE